MAKTLEDMLISQGALDRIYKGSAELYLWRALRKESSGSGNPLYPEFDVKVIKRRDGSVQRRLPDMETEDKDGETYVFPVIGKGTSLFDKEGAFGNTFWVYFRIPKGTFIPEGLIITKDEFNSKYNATHYTISPNYRMTKSDFLRLLDDLRRNALEREKALKSEKGGE